MLVSGTVLEPKFDVSVGHAVVLRSRSTDFRDFVYTIKGIKSGLLAHITEEELLSIYNPIGQSDIGKTLFCEDRYSMSKRANQKA